MKKLFNLMYCDGILTTEVVHYIVKVGISDRDQKAAASIIRKAASDPNLYFHINDSDGARFMELIRQSLEQPTRRSKDSWRPIMRTMVIDVARMASLIRNIPLPLLNSSRIEYRAA